MPVIKVSGNPEKMTNPGFKDVYRIVNKQTGRAEADYITLREEDDVIRGERIKLFDPVHPYIHKFIEGYEAVPLLQPIFADGELVYELPKLDVIREYHKEQLQLFWPQYLRKLNPEAYRVNLSMKAWQLKMDLIHQHQE